jgi:hypothetical protein
VMAYCSDPSPHTDLTDPADTRALVRTFVLPGILALRLEAGGASPPLRSSSTTASTTTTTTTTTTTATATTKGAAQ